MSQLLESNNGQKIGNKNRLLNTNESEGYSGGAPVCGSEFSLDYAANCPLMWLCFYNYERKVWDQMIIEIPSCSESYNSRLL